MKKICILGSTGSIGTQALDIIRKNKEKYKVIALSANNNIELLTEQALEFNPKFIVVTEEKNRKNLKDRLNHTNIEVLCGVEGLEMVSSHDEVEIVLTSVVGMIGLKPTIAAIRANKTIALANKETMVVGGEIIKKELKKSKSFIIPVDSEHNAIFQCLQNNEKNTVRRIILTASGGPFRGKNKMELKNVTPEMAVKHPRWNMGKKISVDSATLMNKALEVIEAHWLFDIEYDKIDVVVHPQSVIHSMVEYIDGSVMAQLGVTDMKNPIKFALDYPKRSYSVTEYLNLTKVSQLTFEEVDFETFECLKLGYEAGKIGGSMPTVLNAANEEAVKLFLDGKIGFLDIPELIKASMKNHNVIYDLSIDKILDIENKTRQYINELIK
ncbi:1-deoxy-D-xylulose 5-phosphate reductoisomerase [Caloramator mitchellensis]|uniref:1-deoxy-D-xylulose 5-phosphate reductoisomerase n=1 Tax=Caloramator mitchellensis TaxID=908809 RepID=A0A0R3JTW0_CALMK|nr:1-deoxy-D-xylulose-5-phosphate reductoisomerase [Caloramator mitchellensis]KRQ86982.1 1-deoxy-D-xylulose 5-phosphate reductoisomerase [Caloramator mitchellensis]